MNETFDDTRDTLLKKPMTPTLSKRVTKKIMLLGYNNVGKSAMANKFIHDYFPTTINNSSIEEQYKKTIK